MKLSKRRINQIWKIFRETNNLPIIGENLGRPKNPDLPEEERRLIIETRNLYKSGARVLEKLIKEKFNIHIPHNRIHMQLLKENLAEEQQNKKKRRKWVRYERKHSMSLGHMDWKKFC